MWVGGILTKQHNTGYRQLNFLRSVESAQEIISGGGRLAEIGGACMYSLSDSNKSG
jgi:hypothetical protein